jgi:hypothetical protein
MVNPLVNLWNLFYLRKLETRNDLLLKKPDGPILSSLFAIIHLMVKVAILERRFIIIWPAPQFDQVAI